MNICIISDSKNGHLSQTRGLAQALIERASILAPQSEHRCIEWDVSKMPFWEKFFYKGETSTSLDLVLCAGHSTHLAALSLARKAKCLCMVCMRPSLPIFLFDLVLMPQHDLKVCQSAKGRIFLSKGALNSIKPSPNIDKKHSLLLIGGPSKEYGWDSEMLINQIGHIARQTQHPMLLTTSRRTPKDFIADIARSSPSIRIEPVERTPQGWIAKQLAASKDIWVTQDSVSMVYEALSSGAPVGILDMPRLDKRKGKISRITRGLHQLLQENRVSRFSQWAKNHQLPAAQALNESGRAADYILKHYPKLFT